MLRGGCFVKDVPWPRIQNRLLVNLMGKLPFETVRLSIARACRTKAALQIFLQPIVPSSEIAGLFRHGCLHECRITCRTRGMRFLSGQRSHPALHTIKKKGQERDAS